jgi:predicted nucleotidyltransferase
LNVDFDLARRFIASEPPPGTLLAVGLTGSHLYGFPSPDSDLDLKGLHLAPIDAVLGLDPLTETHDRLQIFEGVECDLTTHEARKAIALLLRGNGNMLERLLSPYQLYPGPMADRLAALARGSISRKFFNHYAGFFKGMCREYDRLEKKTAKKMLYCYRVAMTGTHLLKTGSLECNVTQLAQQYGHPLVDELVALKMNTAEKVALTPELDARYRAAWPDLDALIKTAMDNSTLPDTPTNKADWAAWLIAARKAQL